MIYWLYTEYNKMIIKRRGFGIISDIDGVLIRGNNKIKDSDMGV